LLKVCPRSACAFARPIGSTSLGKMPPMSCEILPAATFLSQRMQFALAASPLD
jgi:hypothetical protein